MESKMFILVFCLAATVPVQARAQERVLVLEIGVGEQYGDQFADVATLLTDRLRQEIAAVEGWEVSPTRMTTPEARQAQGCLSQWIDRDCFRRIAQAEGVGHVLFGTLRPDTPQEPNPFTVTLSRYELASDQFAGSTFRRIATDGPSEEIAARIQTIIGEEDLNIRPRTTVVAVPQSDPQHRSVGPGVQTWLGVGALTLAAGSLAAMIASWMRIDDIQNDPVYHGFRSTPWPVGVTDVCGEAREGRGPEAQVARVRGLCDEAATWEALQWIFLVSSIGMATTGVALITLDLSEGQQLEVQPSAGPTGASLQATLRF